VEFDPDGVPMPVLERPMYHQPSVSLSIFAGLFHELPTSGELYVALETWGPLLQQLEADFPIHVEFDDADLFERDEMLVVLLGPRRAYGDPLQRSLHVFIRRPVPIDSVPTYLRERNERWSRQGILHLPELFEQQREDEARRHPGTRWPLRWQSVLRNREVAKATRQHPATEPPEWPFAEWGDIPF
jgi:hypothetical protein